MKKLLSFVILLSVCLFMNAQAFHKVSDKDKALLKVMKPVTPQVGLTPNFIIKDDNDKFMFGISGFIKPIYGWDIGNVLDDIMFIPAQLNVPAQKGNKTDFFGNPFHSALEFHMAALPHTANQTTFYIQLMYNAPKASLQVHHIFLKYKGLTMGKTLSLFTDGGAMPVTIDPQGPNGAVHVPTIRFSYEKEFDNGLGLGISAEKPTFDKYSNSNKEKDYDGDASQPIPDIPAYIQYKGRGENRIRISGLFRNMYYVDKIDDKTRSVVGWGAQISGTLQPVKPLMFYYQFAYGKGIGNYIQDLNGYPISYIPKSSEKGKMKAAPMMGWFAGVSYKFENNLTLGYMYSMARIWETGEYSDTFNYKYGTYMAANAFYPVLPFLEFGIEWLLGRKKELTHESGHINRIQGTLKLNF